MLQQIDTAIGFAVVMLLLSLMVTAAVQLVTTITDVRGRNLRWGLSKMLKQAIPKLAEKKGKKMWECWKTGNMADELAQEVIGHPALTHGSAMAKAIRRDELINVLKVLAQPTPAGESSPGWKQPLMEAFSKTVPGGEQTMADTQGLIQKLGTRFPEIEFEIRRALSQTQENVLKLEKDIETWFDCFMDRTTDSFTRHTRIITIATSTLIVVALHIDSGAIYKQISGSAELRASLAGMVDSTQREADRVLQANNTASKAIETIRGQYAGNTAVNVALGDVPDNLARCAQGESWLNLNPTVRALPEFTEIQTRFAGECDRQTIAAIGFAGVQLQRIGDGLADTEVTIIPDRVGGQEVFSSRAAWLEAYGNGRHLLGTIATAILLSLGAPFWFNALRQLANLKPSIANKVEQETQPAPATTAPSVRRRGARA